MSKRAGVLFLLFLIILITADLTYGAKANKKRKGKKKVTIPVEEVEKSSQKRPSKTSPELYCNACQAIIRESIKTLKHRKSEADVFDFLSEACE